MSFSYITPSATASTLVSQAPLIAAAISADIRAIQIWRERAIELEAIREFGKNWDGHGSDAPSSAAMDAASLFLTICKEINYANAPARIALSPSGFLSVDWFYDDTLVRAEIQDTNEIEWMHVVPGKPTEFFTTPLVEEAGPEFEQVQTWRPVEDELASASAR
jgi:hypothetical protein